jgi:hypothetical protein
MRRRDKERAASAVGLPAGLADPVVEDWLNPGERAEFLLGASWLGRMARARYLRSVGAHARDEGLGFADGLALCARAQKGWNARV